MDTETKRRPGRPRIHAEEPGRIEVRIAPALRKTIRHAAVEDGVTLSDWMVRAAQRELDRRAHRPASSEQDGA